MDELLAEVTRNERVESVHRGHIAVVKPTGEIVAGAGEVKLATYLRSGAKPFQAMPLIESGAVKDFGLSVQELAVMMASHSAEEAHLEAVRSILTKVGLSEQDLRCGFHRPMHGPSADFWVRAGAGESPLYNNCSGKHAGMLALAKYLGQPLDSYLQTEHPVQQKIKHKLSLFCGLSEAEIATGIDGCGAPVFFLPVQNMATAYARLAEGKLPLAETIFKIMTAFPEMVAGAGRFDTVLMRFGSGKIVSKIGAEGIRCAGIRTEEGSLGVALKISDGNARVSAVVLLEVLLQIGVFREDEISGLQAFRRPLLKNCAGIAIGEIRPAFVLDHKREVINKPDELSE